MPGPVVTLVRKGSICPQNSSVEPWLSHTLDSAADLRPVLQHILVAVPLAAPSACSTTRTFL